MADFLFCNHGSITILTPRYAQDILCGIAADGLEVGK
jgi:hypothetical protein